MKRTKEDWLFYHNLWHKLLSSTALVQSRQHGLRPPAAMKVDKANFQVDWC